MSVAEIDAPSRDLEAKAADQEAPESLREVADRMSDMLPPGFRVEILRGSIVVSPSPSKKHNGIIYRIQNQLAAQIPDELAVFQTTSVGEDDAVDFAIPDLMVVPLSVEEEDGSLVDPGVTEMVVEVVSRSNPENDTHTKLREYASFGIPLYLIVDPRKGTVSLYSTPEKGKYQEVHTSKFGESVALPSPLDGATIDTSGFKVY